MILTKLQYYMKTGICKFGSTCKFHHPKERLERISTNALGFPLREVNMPVWFLRVLLVFQCFLFDLKRVVISIAQISITVYAPKK